MIGPSHGNSVTGSDRAGTVKVHSGRVSEHLAAPEGLTAPVPGRLVTGWPP